MKVEKNQQGCGSAADGPTILQATPKSTDSMSETDILLA